MCLIILGALLLSQIDNLLWYPSPPPPPTFILSSIYMHKEGKWKSNDIKYAQVNKTKVIIYCHSNQIKWNKNLFLLISWSNTIMVT